jgi:hypothetical protein
LELVTEEDLIFLMGQVPKDMVQVSNLHSKIQKTKT